MLKIFFDFFKKLIVSILLIYSYNKLALPLDIFIPINFITIFMVFLCGIPSIFVLIAFSLFF